MPPEEGSRGPVHAAALPAASRGRRSAGSARPGARRRRLRRRRRRAPLSLLRYARTVGAGHADRAARSGGGCGCGAASWEPAPGSGVSEEPRSAEFAARPGAMEIGTEISRKIRVRLASGGGGKPGLGGRTVVRSNGDGGPSLDAAAWSPESRASFGVGADVAAAENVAAGKRKGRGDQWEPCSSSL